MIDTNLPQATLETLTQPLTQELQQLQRDLADFESKLQEFVLELKAAENGGEQDAVRIALALDQLRLELVSLFADSGRSPLPQLAMQAGGRLRHLSTHFRAIAREEQIKAQIRRTEANIAGRARLTSSSLG
ncbi:MAG TPA: hypothetical protein VKU00_08905 [Chthonomonadaceae bacterium]|nr:hypothetical protein [Chthonomonadaceae bacterium]